MGVAESDAVRRDVLRDDRGLPDGALVPGKAAVLGCRASLFRQPRRVLVVNLLLVLMVLAVFMLMRMTRHGW